MRSLLGIALVLGSLMACEDTQPSARQLQAEKAAQAANEISFGDNAEIKNIQARLQLTSRPGQIGYIVLLNESGTPVLYTTVKGKITSGSKRLTRPDGCGFEGRYDCPSDEGTYGSSSPYIFFWDQSGRYHQWSGEYLYSDQPIRLSVEPLVIQTLPE